MATYISILRGINVSGQKLIKMDRLKKMYEDIGFTNPISYLQSGNVIFNSNESDIKKVEASIFKGITDTFSFDVPVIVLTSTDLEKIIKHNPFVNDKKKDPTFFHVTFLADKPINKDMTLLIDKKQEHEDVILIEKAVYLYCPNGYGRTKLNNNFIENKLRVRATTRNWKTTNMLLTLSMK